MDELHAGKEPWDWEQPSTVELRPDPKTGITDLVSTTAELRAQQSLHDKEQRRLEESLINGVAAFEQKTIETVEDTYWVKEQYQTMVSQLNLMDEGTLRGELLERVTSRYEVFSVTIREMSQTIALYEQQKAREQAEAQKLAEEEAVKRRNLLEIETRKNEFLTALQDVEALEYQSPDAQALVQTAINKLPLVADYAEAASYSQRLNAAITRISSLPTAETWQRTQTERQAAETREQEAVRQQISLEQQKLYATLNREQVKWAAGSQPPVHPSPTIQAGEED